MNYSLNIAEKSSEQLAAARNLTRLFNDFFACLRLCPALLALFDE